MSKILKIVAITIIFLFIGYLFYFFGNSFIKQTIRKEIEILEIRNNYLLENRINKIDNLETQVKNNQVAILEKSAEINFLKNEMDNKNIQLEALKIEIANVKNLNPENEKIKYTFIRILNKIQVLAHNNEKFLTEIEQLLLLAKHENTLINEINKLKQFNNSNNSISVNKILNNFDLEALKSDTLLNKNEIKHKNEFVNKVLNNFIKIKKVQDKEILKQIQKNIANIRFEVVNLNFYNAINLINEYKYETLFSKTIINLKHNIEFNKILGNILILIN